MKRIIVGIAALLFITTASPVNAEQTAAVSAALAAQAVQVTQHATPAPSPAPFRGGMEIPLLGLAVSGLLYGAGRVWGR